MNAAWCVQAPGRLCKLCTLEEQQKERPTLQKNLHITSQHGTPLRSTARTRGGVGGGPGRPTLELCTMCVLRSAAFRRSPCVSMVASRSSMSCFCRYVHKFAIRGGGFCFARPWLPQLHVVPLHVRNLAIGDGRFTRFFSVHP